MFVLSRSCPNQMGLPPHGLLGSTVGGQPTSCVTQPPDVGEVARSGDLDQVRGSHSTSFQASDFLFSTSWGDGHIYLARVY